MATGYDERYARQLHEQSLESEIIRGISQFPTDSIRNDPDAFLAWQLQNQEFEGRKEKNSMPLGMLNSIPSPTHNIKIERKEDKNKNQFRGGGDEKHPLIIIDSDDSDTECDAPSVCEMDTDEVVRYSDNGRNSANGVHIEESCQYPKQNGEDTMDSLYQSLTENGSLLAQPQSEDVNSTGHTTFTFYSDDVEEDSIGEISHYDEDVSSPQCAGFPLQPFQTQPKIVNGSPNYHQRNNYHYYPPPMKGSRRGRKWSKKQNNHYESSNLFHSDSEADNGSITVNSDDETQPKQIMLDTPDHIPKRHMKNYRKAQKTFQKGSDTVNDELVARRLGRELNRTQVEKDGEMARRMQEEEDEKNNLIRAERNSFLDRQLQQRSHPHLQMHDPYANRVIRHRTPFQLHGLPEGLLLLQSILGMEGQMMPPHLMQNNVDLSDYEALWELAERIGDAKGSGISEEALQSLSTAQFQSSTADTNDVNECRICISDFSDGEMITSLSCNHRFHKDCIEKWLKRKAVCPICRENIHNEN